MPAASRSALRGFDPRQVEQRDALVQKSDLQFWIAGARFLKGLEAFLEKLLIHVSRAQVVQACSFGGGVRLGMGILRSSGKNGRRGQGNADAEQEASLIHARNK